ncbi:MAG: M20 family metallopeptidase [Actinomycetota bacterium]
MTASIVDLASTLVRTPSQGGIDDPGPVLSALEAWLADHGVPVRYLVEDARAVALYTEISTEPGPLYCLNACLDTAPVGDLATWSTSPFAGELVDGWLTGRGSADSKTGAAIFAHLAVEMAQEPESIDGAVGFLFDVDEHTGRFGGIKRFIAARPNVRGVMIGYPGNSSIVVGARGFWRARLCTFGTGGHSGSRAPRPDNAVVKAAALVQALNETSLPVGPDLDFDFGPKLTVTAISGGDGYTSVPDTCWLRVDVRLTPSFGPEAAEDLVRSICAQVDDRTPTREPTAIHIEESWPAYRLPEQSPIVSALRASAEAAFGRNLPLAVAGPSNVGNYLASVRVPATCGLGVTYRNLHASDEAVDVASIGPVYEAYRDAVRHLVGPVHLSL